MPASSLSGSVEVCIPPDMWNRIILAGPVKFRRVHGTHYTDKRPEFPKQVKIKPAQPVHGNKRLLKGVLDLGGSDRQLGCIWEYRMAIKKRKIRHKIPKSLPRLETGRQDPVMARAQRDGGGQERLAGEELPRVRLVRQPTAVRRTGGRPFTSAEDYKTTWDDIPQELQFQEDIMNQARMGSGIPAAQGAAPNRTRTAGRTRAACRPTPRRSRQGRHRR